MKLRDQPRAFGAKTPLTNPFLRVGARAAVIAAVMVVVRVTALAAATGAGVGFIPLAPGTFGSLVGVLLFFQLAPEGPLAYFAGLGVLLGLGVWASGRAERIFDSTDDGRIVIDEVVGQLIALAPLVALLPLFSPLAQGAGVSGPGISGIEGIEGTGGIVAIAAIAGRGAGSGQIENVSFNLLVVTGFVVFRVLDIYKPGVIRWVERNVAGGAGVMADDCVAGVIGALGLALLTAGILWLE